MRGIDAPDVCKVSWWTSRPPVEGGSVASGFALPNDARLMTAGSTFAGLTVIDDCASGKPGAGDLLAALQSY